MRRFILFLVRLKLGIRKNQYFRFSNQRTSALYYICECGVMRVDGANERMSNVSINWLLDDKCEILVGEIC